MIVVGGGPAGLAAAAALKMAGVEASVLERAAEVGASWMAHYDRLHLHTVRWLSALPGLPIPRAFGPWVARDDVVRYLKAYAQHHSLDVRLGISVKRITPGFKIETSTGSLAADRVIVATGYNLVPYVPPWPGFETFGGERLHAAQYKSGARFRGKHVLVVGGGNTGAEIAVDLAEQGAARVELAFRTPPNILPRTTAGIPTQALGIFFRRFPARLVDAIGALVNRLALGDLSRFGVPRSPRGAFTRARDDGQIAILDVGLVEQLRRGAIHVAGAVERFDEGDVVHAGGTRSRPDVVIAATGYRRGLEPLVGDLDVLDANGIPRMHGAATDAHYPGLYFIGFTTPVSGALREIRYQARAIARAIAH